MEFLSGWNKKEGDEEGDGIILVYLFIYFFGRIWVCALVLCLRLLFCFGFGLFCACDIEEDGRRRVDRVFIRKEKEHRGEIGIKIRIFVL